MPMRPEETPVPIPNTTVKSRAAEGTMLETAWENRRAPEFKKNQTVLQDSKCISHKIAGKNLES